MIALKHLTQCTKQFTYKFHLNFVKAVLSKRVQKSEAEPVP